MAASLAALLGAAPARAQATPNLTNVASPQAASRQVLPVRTGGPAVDAATMQAIYEQVKGSLVSFGIVRPASGAGTFLRNDSLVFTGSGGEQTLMPVDMIRLRGAETVAAGGQDPAALVGLYVDAINQAVAHRPAHLAIGVHMCRGNLKGTWMAEGGYDPIAEQLFNQATVDAFFLEFDTPRAGDFAPLRHVPKTKTVVLGLVSSKTPVLEHADDIKRRINEAARYVDLDRLCLSPQCGFSSTVHGNNIAVEAQRAKLAPAAADRTSR